MCSEKTEKDKKKKPGYNSYDEDVSLLAQYDDDDAVEKKSRLGALAGHAKEREVFSSHSHFAQ
jgi:hypothetical protein